MLPDTSPAPANPDEERWEELLQFIEDGRVIPVVGRDLMTVEIDGRQTLLYSWLAEQLAKKLRVEFESPPERFSLNAVASRYLAQQPEPETIYYELHKMLRRQTELEPPEPLRKLASIEPLKLFVSTTFDSLLARAIDVVRFDGVACTRSLAFSPREKEDLEADMDQLERPVVYHLLGKVSPLQDYVVTEEDALEFVHSLQAVGPPVNLFTEVAQSPLLIVGCSIPAWLVRPFIRAARRQRLLLARGKTDFIVDATAHLDAALVQFLQNFKTRTEFFQESNPIAFVDELHRRWHARVGSQPAAAAPAELPRMTPGAIFVSYASEDRPTAQALRDALDAAGMDVWFDRDRLFVGDAFEAKIRRNIDQCSLFIPLLSRATLTRERRFFRLEWDHAQRVAVTAPASSQFILPVAIDDLPPDHEDLPAAFRALHWERVQGRPSQALVDQVRSLYRDFQSRTLVRA